MKVVQINSTYSGSTGSIMLSLAEVFDLEGYENYFAVPEVYLKKDLSYNHFKIGNSFDRKYHALYARIIGKQGYCSKTATKKLINWIDCISPDVIMLHNIHSNFINLNILFKYIKKKQVKTVLVMHDCWLFTGKCYHYLYSGCQKWKNGCENCPQLDIEQKSFFFDKTCSVLRDKKELIGENLNIYIVAVSEWLASQVENSILSARPMKVIKNGIDLTVFYPRDTARQRLGIDTNKFIILGMANKWLSSENKETFDAVVQSLSKDDLLIIVGCDKSKLSSSTDKIKYIEKISAEKLAEYYSAVDVFVNITKADTLPTVNMESIACGTPVITYNSGGSGELIKHNMTGYIVNYGDASELIKAIKCVKTNGKSFYSKNCIEYAAEYFDKNKNFKEYINFIIQ